MTYKDKELLWEEKVNHKGLTVLWEGQDIYKGMELLWEEQRTILMGQESLWE